MNMNMNTNTTKTFQSVHVTENVRKQYQSMALTNAELGKVIIANTNTRLKLKGDSADLVPKSTKD